MPRHQSIADQLRRAIARAEKRGMTRYAIAKASGVTERNVGRIADGDVTPRLDTAEKITKALGGKLRIDIKR